MFSISPTVIPAASAPPTSAPAEVPATQSTRTPCSSKTLSTPTCAMPRAAPPESASPSRGLRLRLAILRHINPEFQVTSSKLKPINFELGTWNLELWFLAAVAERLVEYGDLRGGVRLFEEV